MTRLALLLVIALLAAPALAQQAPANNLNDQLKAAQIEAALANIRLALVGVQVRIANNEFDQAKAELAKAREAITAASAQSDVTPTPPWPTSWPRTSATAT